MLRYDRGAWRCIGTALKSSHGKGCPFVGQNFLDWLSSSSRVQLSASMKHFTSVRIFVSGLLTAHTNFRRVARPIVRPRSCFGGDSELLVLGSSETSGAPLALNDSNTSPRLLTSEAQLIRE